MDSELYAVFRTGGKQYRVAKGDTVRIEKLIGDAGATIDFSEVLMVGGAVEPKIGQPLVTGAVVSGEILRQAKARKVLHFRKEKEGWTRRRGHRQEFTEVRITEVRPG